MLKFNQIIDDSPTISSSLTLPLEQRVKSRLKVTLDNGESAGLFLPRGSQLKDGDRIRAESGEVVLIKAAQELVSTVYVDDALSMARACYHLGNRHVPLQIEADFVRYQHDHVLDDMLRGLGMQVYLEQAPFEPEPGAYEAHSHGHNHAHQHEDTHEHAHGHA